MCVERVSSGRPMTLTHVQCLLNFIMYLKHDVIKLLAMRIFNITLCNDLIFISKCIDGALAHEMAWPYDMEQRCMYASNPYFSCCIRMLSSARYCLEVSMKTWRVSKVLDPHYFPP